MANLARVIRGETMWRLGLIAGAAASMFAVYCAHAYVELATVRPLLVYVLVDGQAPPTCGFCVLGF